MSTHPVRLPEITDPNHATITDLAPAYIAALAAQTTITFLKSICDLKVAAALKPLGRRDAKRLERLEFEVAYRSDRLKRYEQRLEREFHASLLA